MRFRILLTALLALGAIGALSAQEPSGETRPGRRRLGEDDAVPRQGEMTADATFVQGGEKIKFTSAGFQGMEMTVRGRSRARTSNGPCRSARRRAT